MSRKIIPLLFLAAALFGSGPRFALAADARLELWTRNINHPDLVLRKTAIKKLGELGDVAALPSLVALLKDEEPEVRRLAAESLAQIKDPGPIEALKEVARNDNEKKVRLAAARAVERLEGIQDYKKGQEEKAQKKGSRVRQ